MSGLEGSITEVRRLLDRLLDRQLITDLVYRLRACLDDGRFDDMRSLLVEEATVKRFFQEADHVRLQPENEAIEPIRSRDVRVLGKVVGLMRSMS